MGGCPAEQKEVASGCAYDVALSLKNSFLVSSRRIAGFAQILTDGI
jgi:hypothetical protein